MEFDKVDTPLEVSGKLYRAILPVDAGSWGTCASDILRSNAFFILVSKLLLGGIWKSYLLPKHDSRIG